MSEAETRAEHIDPELKTAGWVVVDGSRIRREYFITPGRIEGLGRHASPVGLLFRSDGGTSSVSSVSYVFDANGNVSELLTDTGEIAAHYVEARRKSDCRRKKGRNAIYEQVVLPERGCLSGMLKPRDDFGCSLRPGSDARLPPRGKPIPSASFLGINAPEMCQAWHIYRKAT